MQFVNIISEGNSAVKNQDYILTESSEDFDMELNHNPAEHNTFIDDFDDDIEMIDSAVYRWVSSEDWEND